jgi:hypothetical protein
LADDQHYIIHNDGVYQIKFQIPIHKKVKIELFNNNLFVDKKESGKLIKDSVEIYDNNISSMPRKYPIHITRLPFTFKHGVGQKVILIKGLNFKK